MKNGTKRRRRRRKGNRETDWTNSNNNNIKYHDIFCWFCSFSFSVLNKSFCKSSITLQKRIRFKWVNKVYHGKKKNDDYDDYGEDEDEEEDENENDDENEGESRMKVKDWFSL